MTGDGDRINRIRDTRPRYQQRRRQQQRQRRSVVRQPLSLAATGTNVGDGDDDVTANGDDRGEGLLFGDPIAEEDSSGDGSEEMVMEVDEEELMEEWEARGLNPEAFDPMVLLQMWEEEDAEVG